MGLTILLETLAKIPNRNRIPVGSGAALGGIQTLPIKIGAAKGTEHNPLALVSLPEMMTLWTFR